MEPSGRASEGSQSDPSPEWTSPGPETGLQESMTELGLGGSESYPERPDEADCIYYLRTGNCGYGSRCRFNHPRDRGSVIGAARTSGGGEYPERVGQPVCQYYMRTGSCKYGTSCKYHHPRQGGGSVTPVSVNYYGYPLRPGEKECSYYAKTGQCKYGPTCKFHHPQPTSIPAPSPVPPAQVPLPVPPPPLFTTLQSPSNPSSQPHGVMVPRPLLPAHYFQSPYSQVVLSPTVVPYTGWSPYQTSVSSVVPPVSQSSVTTGQPYGLSSLVTSGLYQPSPSFVCPSNVSQKEHSFPERPGQPECQHYMKTGDCKFGPSCRYHHPPELIAPKTNIVLSHMGLPVRLGAPPCTHYTECGVCKFGPACRFDPPMGTQSYSPSASSLSGMPVAPYPVGSSVGTLAPSSSSSDSRPDLISGSTKDSTSSRKPVSMSTSVSARSTSMVGPSSHSTVQPSSQGSASSTTTIAFTTSMSSNADAPSSS